MYTGIMPQMQHQATTTPPPGSQCSKTMVEAQPTFEPTWHGFLGTTKDAMIVVEAVLRGRLSHIGRKPSPTERETSLTSGTVLVYEEKVSGIKRWTDAVPWSPSRILNNFLINRQLARAIKPGESKAASNPVRQTKRKRKESTEPARSKTGKMLENPGEDDDKSAFDSSLADDSDCKKVYPNFAQKLTPDQQQRFCGCLVDQFEFKEGGLVKKTISVTYDGRCHRVVSYYSLEDVVGNKLKRPSEDSKLSDIQPRLELLTGWKVSIEDEESKDMPLEAGYPRHMQPSHVQHHVLDKVTQEAMQTHAPSHLAVHGYSHGSRYTSKHSSPLHDESSQCERSCFSNPPSAYQNLVEQPSPQTCTPDTTLRSAAQARNVTSIERALNVDDSNEILSDWCSLFERRRH